MRAYFINEISKEDLSRISGFLRERVLPSPLEGLFWGRIPEDRLDETQARHAECHPHVFGIEIGQDWVKLEFFIRSLSDMRCSCSGYATKAQLEYILEFTHTMIQELGVST